MKTQDGSTSPTPLDENSKLSMRVGYFYGGKRKTAVRVQPPWTRTVSTTRFVMFYGSF